MTRISFLLVLTEVRSRWKKELRICICEIFKPETVTVWVSIKNSATKFHKNSNLGLGQRLLKLSYSKRSSSGLDQTLPQVRPCNSSSLEIKKRLPKWDFAESFSSKLNETLPNLRFSNDSNSGPEQRLPKWNSIESSSLRFDLLLPMSGFS